MGRFQRIGLAMLATAASGFGSSAAAQDGWDVEVDAERGIVVASVIYEGGVGIAVQCRDKTLDMVLLGLPPAVGDEVSDRGHRVLDTGPSGQTLRASSWRAQPGSPVATSLYPARLARSLKGAEAYVVRIPAHDDSPARRMAIPVPSDGTGLDQVLSACGRATEDPRDALPMVDPLLVPGWTVEGFDYTGLYPRPGDTLNTEYSCVLAPENRVRDCRIEFQNPENSGGSRRFLASADRVTITYDGTPGELDGHIVYWSSSMSTVVDYIATVPAR
jgi:hypothetical protein